jgi:UDPglucose--hexose-1-phosphate uridylyltransferase
MPQLRQNIVTNEWVIIAPERSKRPSDFIHEEAIKETSEANDPFALSSDHYKHTRIKGYETDHIYVIRNKYPVFIEDDAKESPRTFRLEDGFYGARPSTGGHDVIVIKDAKKTLYTFSRQEWYELFSVAKKRFLHWKKSEAAEHAMLIYNHGANAGASLTHPHAQIFVANIIPNQIVREMAGAEQYFINNGKNVFADLIFHEKKEGERVIAENDEFIAFTCYAARFPFETWVLPKEQCAHFEDERETYIHSLGQIMEDVMTRFGRVLKNPALNFYLHDLPSSVSESDYFRWHIEITPRLGTYGGYELGSGVVVNTMSPEKAADYLRKSRQTA